MPRKQSNSKSIKNNKEEIKDKYTHFIPEAKEIINWKDRYKFVLINSMDELESIFEGKKDYFISFDTETTGLDFENIDLVGYSFCLDGKTAYYVPVYHYEYPNNLGKQAVDFIYSKLVDARKVFMFNARYDLRILEYYGYKEHKDLFYKDRRFYTYYDTSKINYYDVAIPCWLADTNKKMPSLKWSSRHFLGYEQLHFDEVIDGSENFFYLNPIENENVTIYAASDALCTFLLVGVTMRFFKEGGLAAKADNLLVFPLMKYENERIWLDIDKIDRMMLEANTLVSQKEQEVYRMLGKKINLNSPAQVASAFKDIGIDTGTTTDSGNMSVSMTTLEKLPDSIKQKYPELRSYIEYKETFKLLSSYIKVLSKEAISKGYVRCAYKTTEVPTGRLASGKDGKNSFFTPINIQSLPKPHVQMEDVFDLGDRSLFSKKDNIILGYQFVKSKYNENGEHIIPEDNESKKYIGQSEGMDEKLNIRSLLTPKMDRDSNDDEWVYVSCDYSAEELRLAANISREGVWLDAFVHGGDVHKSCYSMDTEFLTSNGYKKHENINPSIDSIAYYDDKTKEILFDNMASYYPQFNIDNKYIVFKCDNFELKVTTNHRMYIKYTNTKEWHIETALNIYNKHEDIEIKDEFGNIYTVKYSNIKLIELNTLEKFVCYNVPTGLLIIKRGKNSCVCGNTAISLWGEENYNRDYRKRAKAANFGILYGMSAMSLYENPLFGFKEEQEAFDFFELYKKALPTLFSWEKRVQDEAKRKGTVKTFFGRPRRVRGYYQQHKDSFANRTAVNTQIQGTAGDILKIVLVKLWKQLLGNPEYRNDVKFVVTIHDEIGYGVRASRLEEITSKIVELQTMKLPQWPAPIITEPSFGYSIGRVYDFVYDEETGHYKPDVS